MSSPTPLAAILVLAVAVSTPAWGQPSSKLSPVTVQVRVPVGDLDLSKPAGADELLRRVRVAARRACGSNVALSPLLAHGQKFYRACSGQAVGRAIASLDAPMVHERYAALTNAGQIELAEAGR